MDTVGRPRGGGVSVFVDRRGKRWFRARLYVDGREEPLGLYESEADAQAVVDAARAQLAVQTARPSAATLGTYGLAWLAARERGGLVRGIAEERSAWRTRVAPYPIAELPLQAITRGHVVRWLRALAEAPTVRVKKTRGGVKREKGEKTLSRQSLKHALRLVRRCLAAALEEELIASDPTAGVELPATRVDGTGDGASWTWLTADEIERLLSTTRVGRKHRSDLELVPEEHRLAWTVLIYAGLRRGEIGRAHV